MEQYTPLLNDTKVNFSSRDSLGIESVFTSISANLCPIINTVTPRAFYWAFMCWIYYDFYKNSGIKTYTVSEFDKRYLKRQDYYFVLANLIANNSDQFNLVGKQKAAQDAENYKPGPYPFNKDYFVTTYGGMQYYNAGCLTMGFITFYDEEHDNVFKYLPRPTQYGEKMAKAFESVIKDSIYYKEYRLKDEPVPRDVLLEYGSIINLGMKGFDECKALLRAQLFGRNPSLALCADYARHINRLAGNVKLDQKNARYFLFDYFSPAGERYSFPNELQASIVGWEIAVGRQYFTTGLEIIWKYMLQSLTSPSTLHEWIDNVLNTAQFSTSLSRTLKTILPSCYFSFNEREVMIAEARKKKMNVQSVESGLMLSLSIYNRFSGRDDLGDCEKLLDYGKGRVAGRGSLSLNEWKDLILRYENKTIREFLIYIMEECIINQHIRTCFDKLTRSSNNVYGFYFECMGDLYVKNEYGFQVDFQGNRFVQLMQVMDDLDMFDGATGV